MKKSLLIVALFAFLASPVFGQLYFSASPGLNLNGANIGYSFGKLVPYGGFQMLNAKFSLNSNDFGWDYNANAVVEDKYSTDAKGGIYIPTIGAKYFIMESNKLKGYFVLSLSKPIVSAKITFEQNGIEQQNDMINSIVKGIDDIKMFGAKLGFGVEYFFDDNFSLAAEFGIRYMKNKFNMEELQDNIWTPTGDVERTIKREVNLDIMPTYTKFSLNFYFGGGKGVTAD
jgi:hypothetical protein